MKPELIEVYKKILGLLYDEKARMESNGTQANGYRNVNIMIRNLEQMLGPRRAMETQEPVNLDQNLVNPLLMLGLEKNDAKVYAFLVQYGNVRTAGDIAKSLAIRRMQAYRAIKYLEGIGLVVRTPYTLHRRGDRGNLGGYSGAVAYYATEPDCLSDYVRQVTAPKLEALAKFQNQSKQYIGQRERRASHSPSSV